jgi:YHS domain-containing protein
MESIVWFLITGALFFFMMKFGCGAHMGGHGGHGAGHEGHGNTSEEPPTATQKVKDPVCGMEVDINQAYSMVRKGNRQIFFCSEQCSDKFNKEPEKYL